MRLLTEVIGHFRLAWRLFWDVRVHWWQRAIFVVPLLYFLVPFRYDALTDLAPLVGLLDDWLLFVLWTYLFVALCPRSAARSHRRAILLSDPDPEIRRKARADLTALAGLSPVDRLEMYRHPQEMGSLSFSLLILIAVSALGGVLAGVLMALGAGLSYVAGRALLARVLHAENRVDMETYPQVQAALDRCFERVPAVPVNVFVTASQSPNAFTFGVDEPYTIVISSQLVDHLTDKELVAVIGHEVGHVLFQHTLVSSLMGGMLYRMGILALLWSPIFSRWRRFAELTGDRTALLVTGDVNLVVQTLAKLATGVDGERIDVQALFRDALSEGARSSSTSWARLLRVHPSLLTRVRALADFDAELFTSEVEDWLTAGPAK